MENPQSWDEVTKVINQAIEDWRELDDKNESFISLPMFIRNKLKPKTLQKARVEYWRQDKCLSNYGWMKKPKELEESSILDFLTKWSQENNALIYSHTLEKAEENFDKYAGEYRAVAIPYGGLKTRMMDIIMGENRVSYCDWVYYLNIYYYL